MPHRYSYCTYGSVLQQILMFVIHLLLLLYVAHRIVHRVVVLAVLLPSLLSASSSEHETIIGRGALEQSRSNSIYRDTRRQKQIVNAPGVCVRAATGGGFEPGANTPRFRTCNIDR